MLIFRILLCAYFASQCIKKFHFNCFLLQFIWNDCQLGLALLLGCHGRGLGLGWRTRADEHCHVHAVASQPAVRQQQANSTFSSTSTGRCSHLANCMCPGNWHSAAAGVESGRLGLAIALQLVCCLHQLFIYLLICCISSLPFHQFISYRSCLLGLTLI